MISSKRVLYFLLFGLVLVSTAKAITINSDGSLSYSWDRGFYNNLPATISRAILSPNVTYTAKRLLVLRMLYDQSLPQVQFEALLDPNIYRDFPAVGGMIVGLVARYRPGDLRKVFANSTLTSVVLTLNVDLQLSSEERPPNYSPEVELHSLVTGEADESEMLDMVAERMIERHGAEPLASNLVATLDRFIVPHHLIRKLRVIAQYPQQSLAERKLTADEKLAYTIFYSRLKLAQAAELVGAEDIARRLAIMLVEASYHIDRTQIVREPLKLFLAELDGLFARACPGLKADLLNFPGEFDLSAREARLFARLTADASFKLFNILSTLREFPSLSCATVDGLASSSYAFMPETAAQVQGIVVLHTVRAMRNEFGKDMACRGHHKCYGTVLATLQVPPDYRTQTRLRP